MAFDFEFALSNTVVWFETPREFVLLFLNQPGGGRTLQGPLLNQADGRVIDPGRSTPSLCR